MRRFSARARGRAAPIEKFFSRLTIVVREGEAKAAPKKAAKKAAPKAEAAKKETAPKKPAAKKKAAGQQDKE
jgi:hypothetical protein